MKPDLIKIKKIKCPRCGAEPIILTEEWRGHVIEFEVFNGQRQREGILSDGEPCRVFATCNCEHTWRLRGANQIWSIDAEAKP